MKAITTTIGICLLCTCMMAQLPDTDLFAFTFDTTDGGQFVHPKLLNGETLTGYNNQPAFINDWVYYTQTEVFDDSLQTDIFALHLPTKTKRRVTETAESEYSPTPMPDGKNFSVVRVEQNGDQRLWALPIKQDGPGEPVFENVKNVGYHAWLDDRHVAMFLVGDESKGIANALVVSDLVSGNVQKIADDPGRCLKVSPDGHLMYLEKMPNGLHFIKKYNPNDGRSTVFCQALPGQEDYDVLGDGSIISADGAEVFIFMKDEKDWMPMASASAWIGERKISRIAMRNKLLVAVVK